MRTLSDRCTADECQGPAGLCSGGGATAGGAQRSREWRDCSGRPRGRRAPGLCLQRRLLAPSPRRRARSSHPESRPSVTTEGPAGKRRCEPSQEARPPVPAAALYLFISVDKAESSILKTKIFPGSLYLLIFQFLAAAFSAEVGGGPSSRLQESGTCSCCAHRRLSLALLRLGAEGSPGDSQTYPLPAAWEPAAGAKAGWLPSGATR